MAFDVQAALKAGYSPADIADYLGSKSNFDVDAARKAGYKDDEITTHLLEVQPKASPQKPLPEGVTPSEGRSATPMGKPDPRLIKPEDDRTIMQRVKDFINPEYKSVLETAAEPPTPVERQAEIDKRLSYGAGPISKETLGQADLVRGGLAQTEDPRVQQIAQEMANRGETGVGGLIARAKKPENVAAAQDAKAEEFRTAGQWAFDTLVAAPAQFGASFISLPVNIIAPSSALGDTLRKAQKDFKDLESDQLKARQARMAERVNSEDGFINKYATVVAELVTTPSLALQETVKQAGYFLGVLGLARAGSAAAGGLVGLAGRASPTLALGEAISGGAIQTAARAAGATGGGAAASVIMAGGDAAGSTYEALTDPNKTPLKEWQKNEDYQRLTAGGMSSKDAIKEIATTKARIAAAIVAPLGLFGYAGAEAAIVSRGIAKSLNQKLAAQSGAKIFGKELVGENIEEMGTQLGGNVVTQTVNPNQDLLEGVAEAGATATVTSGPFAALAARNEYKQTLADQPGGAQFAGSDAAARYLLNPNTYDAQLISPLQTVDPSKVLQTKTVDEAIASADDLSGTLNFTPAATPLDLTGAIPPAPDLTGAIPPAPDLTGRIEPTLDMQTPTVELPAPNPVTEQQFGLDKLRLAPVGVPSENAPATAADKTLDIPGETLPRAATAPVGGESAATAARTAAQNSLDRWAAANNVDTPAVFNPATPEMDSAINDIAQALHSKFNARLYAYNDNRADALNGVAIGGAAFVNTGSVDINAARTSLHEFHHTIEQIAALEARQGQTDTEAQKYVASMNSVFDGMTDAGKQAYITNFLHKDELAGIADPVAREQRVQELIAAPQTRSEMVADFLGNRATDKKFWKDVAAADPQGFKGFVDKWIGIVDNLIDTLKGTKTQGRKESARVDKYVSDLNAAKVVARDALVNYSKGIQNGSINQGVSEFAASDRQVAGGVGGGKAPSYGTPREGAVSLIGRHYSTEARSSLNGAYYGRGLKGAERDRLDSSPDPRLKNRIYFYVDQGQGIRPESGVGGIAHETKLNNIYDPKTGLIPVKGNFNAFESAVLNAGFDGYVAPFGNNQSAVVLLGPRHSAVPVRPLGRVAGAPAPVAAEPTTLKKGLLSKEVAAIQASRIPGARLASGNLEIPVASREAANAELERIGSDIRFSKKPAKAAPARVMFEVAPDPNNLELKARWDAVPFERKIEISQRVAEKIMPQVFKLAGIRAKMTTQLGGYLEDTSPSFAAIVPSTASAQQLMDVARLGGFGLAQDSMMVLDLKPFEGSFPTGLITVTLPENKVDQESVHAIYRELRQVSPENISGHTTVGQEMVLAVPSDKMVDLASKINGVLSSRPESFTLKTVEGHMAFPSKEEYDYGQAGEGAPELLAKRAEARRIREEASAAIEAELAKDESTGGRKIDTGVYRSVADAFGLSQAQYNASVLPLMLGGVKGKTFRAPNIGGIPETVQWLDQRYRDSGMSALDINKAEDRTTLAKLLAAEAVGAIRSAGNAVEWYDETVAKTLRIMAVKYPELDTDPNARNAFLMAVAIASQTMNVEANLTYASSQYEAFRATGKFPEVGKGKSAPAMAKNFALANDVMADMGPDLLRRFLQTEFTKRELELIGFPIGSESMDEKMLGSAIFGPKIGFGFYSNLTGNFEPITMDMWFMRTIGRLSGTLPAFDPVLFPKQVAKLRAALAETGDSSRGIYAADFKPEDVAAAQETDEGAIALARKIYSLHNRQFIKERAAFDSGARVKTALVGASSGIIKSADKPTDAPASGGERQRLRDVTRQMVSIVEEQTGKRVPPAALQALIWYPEQELYKKLGVDLQVTSQDYAGAAELLLTKEGFDGKRISTAAESGPRQTRQVVGKSVTRTNKQAGQPSGPTGPIQGEERETFIGTRVPLKDIFAGLEKRGLAKANTEAMIARRSDAAQIRYIQDNFLDILDELDSAGLVEINCK